MRKLAVFAILLAGTVAGNPADRKSIFLEKMDGFEVFIEKAATQQNLSVNGSGQTAEPDLKVVLGKKFASATAESIYRKQTGRNESSRLTVLDVKTQKPVLTYDFNMGINDEAKQRAADQFIAKLKKKFD
jgi:hypothetical protein